MMSASEVAPLPKYETIDGHAVAIISLAAYEETKTYADQRKMFERHDVTVLGRDSRGWIIQCKDQNTVKHIGHKYYIVATGGYSSVDDGIYVATRCYPFKAA